MAKPKTKDSKVVSFSLDVKIIEKLNEYCKKTYVPKTKVVELAISKYVDDILAKTVVEKEEEKSA